MMVLLLAAAFAQDVQVPDAPQLGSDPVRVDTFAGRSAIMPSAASFDGFRSTLAIVHVRDPLVFRTPDAADPIAVVGPVWGLHGALARAWGPWAVGVSLPVYATVGTDLHDDPPGSALGDLALDSRFVALDAASTTGVGLAVQGRVTAPLGADSVYLGQPGFTWELLGVGELRPGDAQLGVALGTRGVPEVDLVGTELNDLLVYRLQVGRALGPGGATVELLGQRQYQGFFDDPTNSPLEVLVGGWGDLRNDSRLRGALGWGVNPGIGAPLFRVVVGVGADAVSTPRGPGSAPPR